MNNKHDNSLFPIAAEIHRQDRITGQWPVLQQTVENETVFTLGFCRGVSYATGIFQKQIAELQNQLKELIESS